MPTAATIQAKRVYDVTSDGTRFVIHEAPGADARSPHLRLLQNWPAALGR